MSQSDILQKQTLETTVELKLNEIAFDLANEQVSLEESMERLRLVHLHVTKYVQMPEGLKTSRLPFIKSSIFTI